MALRYFVNGGVNNNWGTTGNWSLTSGGAGGQTVPTTLDDVFFDINSPNCTVNTSNRSCKLLDFTGYTNTITMTFGIGLNGSLTLKSGLLVLGSGGLVMNAGGTITSNTFAWPNSFALGGASVTYTFADPCTILGLTTFQYTTTMTLNGSSTNKLIMAGGLTVISTTVMTSGTADLNITGGTWQHTAAGSLVNNLFLNGNVIIGTNVYYRTGTLTYTTGTIDTTTNNSILNIPSATTFNTNIMLWNNVSFTGGVQTLTSDLNLSGNLTSLSTTINGLFNVNVGGNLRNVGIGTTAGTATLVLNGTGTLSTDSNAGGIQNNLIINTKGTITFGTTVSYNTRTLTYITGKIITKNSTFYLISSATLINCHKILFTNISITGTAVITMNEFFSGSAGVITNISSSGGNYTISFQDNFEKIAKFVNITNCTLTRPMQLLVITNSKRNSRNTGIRYINQSPNGIAKNEPSTLTQTTYGTQMLLNDPGMK